MAVPSMRKGYRIFGGQRYDFLLYKRTKIEAEKSAKVWRERGTMVRITKGKDRYGKVVYVLWGK